MKLAELRAELIRLRTAELEAMATGLSDIAYHQHVGRASAFAEIQELIANKPVEEEQDYLDLES